MLQLYITSTEHVGYYFLYDPVKDDMYEGVFSGDDDHHTRQELQTKSLHDALIHLTDTRSLSQYGQPRTDILLHAPVQIYIQDEQVRKQFNAPWEYEGVWKVIAQKRRMLKYFEIQKKYHMTNLPPATHIIFDNRLHNIQLYQRG